MTRILLVSAGLAAAAVASLLIVQSAGARAWGDDFQPQQPVVSQPGHKEWNWDGRDGLAIEAPVILHYSPAGKPGIVATGPDELLAHIQEGQGRIRVDDDWHYSGHDRVEVTVTGVTVHNIALAGSGHASLDGLSLDHLHLSVAGSGSVKADGRADRVDLSVAGSGNADLEQVAARSANIHIAGSGNVRLSPHDEANVSIAGSGNVRMAARPASLQQSIVGSGRVDFPQAN